MLLFHRELGAKTFSCVHLARAHRRGQFGLCHSRTNVRCKNTHKKKSIWATRVLLIPPNRRVIALMVSKAHLEKKIIDRTRTRTRARARTPSPPPPPNGRNVFCACSPTKERLERSTRAIQVSPWLRAMPAQAEILARSYTSTMYLPPLLNRQPSITYTIRNVS